MLSDPTFDPHQVVLVDSTDLSAPAPANINQSAGTVSINPNYRPKRIELEADVKTPSVLLMTDRYNPKWQVTVDGQPVQLLRCVYIRAVCTFIPGQHKIVLHFTTPLTTLYINLSAMALELVLCIWLILLDFSFAKNASSDKR